MHIYIDTHTSNTRLEIKSGELKESEYKMILTLHPGQSMAPLPPHFWHLLGSKLDVGSAAKGTVMLGDDFVLLLTI